jgi:hypothetical protein
MRHIVNAAVTAAFSYVLGAAVAVASSLGLSACATSHLAADPTPLHPKIACIADSPLPAAQLSKRTGNRLLPEVVRLIGVTPAEDGERWMVVRGGFYDSAKCAGENLHDRSKCDWQPWPKEKIQTGPGCGPEANAFRELQRFDVEAQ